MSALYDGQIDETELRSLLRRDAVQCTTLVHFDFADTPMFMCSRSVGFTDKRGQRWASARGMLVGLPDITFSDDDLAPFREFHLGVLGGAEAPENWREIAYNTIRNKANYQGRPYSFGFQLFDDTTSLPVGYPITVDVGQMSNMELFVENGDEGVAAAISLTCEAGLYRAGQPQGDLLSHSDQLSRHPGDDGLEFVVEKGLFDWTNF